MNLECGGEWISSYVDGELDAEAITLAEVHLATCAACRAQVQAFQRLSQLVAIVRPQPPRSLAQLVMATLPAPALVPRRTRVYMTLGTWTTLLLALGSLGLLTWILPGLGWAWKVISRLFTIVWTAGIWHLLATPTGLLSGAGVVLLCGLLLGLAVYGTRLLDRSGEVAH